MIGLGAKIDATDDNGDSPLIEAAREGGLETVRVLIENGADINLMNKHNKTSLDLANENGDLRYKKSIKFNQFKTYNPSIQSILPLIQVKAKFQLFSSKQGQNWSRNGKLSLLVTILFTI